MSYKKILVTGGAGFIGSNLSIKLIELGYDVTVLDNLSLQIHGNNAEVESPLFLSIKDKVKFIKGTVTSKEDWLTAIADNEVIVHYSAETGTGQSMYEIYNYVNTNIGGTALMLDILANNNTNVKKVIVASSRSIYGEGKYFSEEFGVDKSGFQKALAGESIIKALWSSGYLFATTFAIWETNSLATVCNSYALC